MSRVLIAAGSVKMLAELNDSQTALKVLDALPVESSARTWGEEVYFDVGLSLPDENSHAHVPPGAVAYWPPGDALCLFFGQTPASPVNVIGMMLGNPRDLAAVKPGDRVKVERAPEKGTADPAPPHGQ
jgi:hypothetical protein